MLFLWSWRRLCLFRRRLPSAVAVDVCLAVLVVVVIVVATAGVHFSCTCARSSRAAVVKPFGLDRRASGVTRHACSNVAAGLRPRSLPCVLEVQRARLGHGSRSAGQGAVSKRCCQAAPSAGLVGGRGRADPGGPSVWALAGRAAGGADQLRQWPGAWRQRGAAQEAGGRSDAVFHRPGGILHSR